MRARQLERLVDLDQPIVFARRGDVFRMRKRHVDGAAAALGGPLRFGVVDERMAHRQRGRAQQVRLVDEAGRIAQAHPRLVGQRRRLQRVAAADPAPFAPRHALDLRIEVGKQRGGDAAHLRIDGAGGRCPASPDPSGQRFGGHRLILEVVGGLLPKWAGPHSMAARRPQSGSCLHGTTSRTPCSAPTPPAPICRRRRRADDDGGDDDGLHRLPDPEPRRGPLLPSLRHRVADAEATTPPGAPRLRAAGLRTAAGGDGHRLRAGGAQRTPTRRRRRAAPPAGAASTCSAASSPSRCGPGPSGR